MSAEEGGAHCARNSDPCTTVIRCLKRFVAREIFGYLCRAPKATRREQVAA